MNHNEIYRWFELYFPHYSGDNVVMWFQNGKNSIRIRQINGQEFIFTYNSQKDWKFETIGSFMSDLKKEKKNARND